MSAARTRGPARRVVAALGSARCAARSGSWQSGRSSGRRGRRGAGAALHRRTRGRRRRCSICRSALGALARARVRHGVGCVRRGARPQVHGLPGCSPRGLVPQLQARQQTCLRTHKCDSTAQVALRRLQSVARPAARERGARSVAGWRVRSRAPKSAGALALVGEKGGRGCARRSAKRAVSQRWRVTGGRDESCWPEMTQVKQARAAEVGAAPCQRR
jgi:hypothetical protein